MNAPIPPQTLADAEVPPPTGLGDDITGYVQAWSRLLSHEVRLARTSVAWLFVGAGAIIATALTICVTFAVLTAFLADRWLHDPAADIAIALLLEGVALCILLGIARRCWHNLSLPRSRAALAHLAGRMQ